KDNNKKVLLIDANFRTVNLRYKFKIDSELGIYDIIKNNKDIEECIIRKDGMDILMSGDISVNPEEVIGTERMKNIIDTAKQKYDYILVNTSPVGIYSDAWVLSSFSDKTVLIKGNNEDAINESMDRLKMVGANIVEGYYSDSKECISFTSPRFREVLMA
ncbi:MAG: CpsD/CapB family tyrosine-protein kinase, partial [Peptostreptococcaceae bacterium]